MKTIIHWLVQTAAILITAHLLPGVSVSGLISALILAVVLGAINTFIKPILVIVTLPLTILTLGLFQLVLNALLILLATLIVPGFAVTNFWWALIFAIVLSLISSVLHGMEKKNI